MEIVEIVEMELIEPTKYINTKSLWKLKSLLILTVSYP